MRYDITVFGNKETTAGLVRAVMRDGFTPDLVVTLGGAARQKTDIAGASDSLADWCRSHGIAVYECESYTLNSSADQQFFEKNDFGIGICTGWQRLIPPTVLARFEQGIFGFHGSHLRLPGGRGRSPLNWSLRLGGKAVFHNCFRYSEGADEGGIYNTTEIPLEANETIKSLQFKALLDIFATTGRLLRDYKQGAIALTAQPAGETSWLGKLTPADSQLVFATMDFTSILGIIKASGRPFAGAFAYTQENARAAFWNAAPYTGFVEESWNAAPAGTVLAHALGMALVKCRDGLLLVTEFLTDADDLTGKRFA